MKKISIIIPAHNEEKRIGKTLEEYGRFFSNLRKNKILDSEIIVIINNTQDKTEDVVKKYLRKYRQIKYFNFKEGGKGFAITNGFKIALKGKSDLLGFVDADCSTSPKEYYRLIKKIGNYDGIIASRYLQESRVKPKPTWQRILASRIFNFLIRSFFPMPYKDTQCGAKIFKRDAIKKIIPNLNMTQWTFDINVLYLCKKQGYRILEIPTIWEDKEYSKINLGKAGPQMFLSIIRLRAINSIFEPILRPLKPLAYFFDHLINEK